MCCRRVVEPECETSADCTDSAKPVCDNGICVEEQNSCIDDSIGNSFETATLITAPYSATNTACGKNEDFFKIQLEVGDVITMTLNNYDLNDFDLYLTNGTNWDFIVAESEYNDPDEFIQYTVETAGTYYINVTPFEGEGSYTIDVSVE